MKEQELIIGLQNGEEPAFAELVTLFQDRVYNTALGFLQNSADAEDAAQEVFIQVYRSIHAFKSNSTLSTWIYRITVTKCLDHLRSKKRKKRFGFLTALFNADNTPIYESEDFNHPGVQLDSKEAAAVLFKLMNELPENQRLVFIENEMEDKTLQKIADETGENLKTIISRKGYAMKHLKKRLLPLYNELKF